MEEYMYQKLGYKEIAKKFLDINVEQMKWREEKNFSNIRFKEPTQEMIDKFVKFKKSNGDFGLSSRLLYVIGFISIIGVLCLISCVMLFIDGKIEDIHTIMVVVAFFLICCVVSVCCDRKLYKPRLPIGVVCGYIVATAGRWKEDSCDNEIYSTYLDIWLEDEDKYLLNVEQERRELVYAGEKYYWSDLVYTPIKIFYFANNSIEIMPAYLDK